MLFMLPKKAPSVIEIFKFLFFSKLGQWIEYQREIFIKKYVKNQHNELASIH